MVGEPGTQDGGAHVETTEARAGSTSGTVRRVLVIGTLLGVILLGAVWIFGAATSNDDTHEATASERIADSQDTAREGEDTDGLVGMDDDAASFQSEGTSPRLQEN